MKLSRIITIVFLVTLAILLAGALTASVYSQLSAAEGSAGDDAGPAGPPADVAVQAVPLANTAVHAGPPADAAVQCEGGKVSASVGDLAADVSPACITVKDVAIPPTITDSGCTASVVTYVVPETSAAPIVTAWVDADPVRVSVPPHPCGDVVVVNKGQSAVAVATDGDCVVSTTNANVVTTNVGDIGDVKEALSQVPGISVTGDNALTIGACGVGITIGLP